MNLIAIAIIGFLLLEAANVATLYFSPGSKYANGVGVFKAWEKSKNDPEIHNFVKYLVNWVAGTKLIFLLLLIVILITAGDRSLILTGVDRSLILTAGDRSLIFTGFDRSLIFTGVALVVSIASFFWRLFPLIRKMDRDGQIEPKNYSAVLGWMILAFLVIFLLAVVFSLGG